MKKTVSAMFIAALVAVGLAVAAPSAVAAGPYLKNYSGSGSTVQYRQPLSTTAITISKGGQSSALHTVGTFKFPSGCTATIKNANGTGGSTFLSTAKSGLWLNFSTYSLGQNILISTVC